MNFKYLLDQIGLWKIKKRLFTAVLTFQIFLVYYVYHAIYDKVFHSPKVFVTNNYGTFISKITSLNDGINLTQKVNLSFNANVADCNNRDSKNIKEAVKDNQNAILNWLKKAAGIFNVIKGQSQTDLKQNVSKKMNESSNTELPKCPETPTGLKGLIPIPPAYKSQNLSKIQVDNPLVSNGGYYKPIECIARSKVAIIIAFRNRDEHLSFFLQFMHPIMQRQQLEYRIYVINQYGDSKFNRAKLMNIGFVESIKDHDFGCFVFHDIDHILENDNALYHCPSKPMHLAVGVDKFNYQLLCESFFGGVSEMTREQFTRVNGFSNIYWGWGGEDDDLYERIIRRNMNVMRYPASIARYFTIRHNRDKGNEVNPERMSLLSQVSRNMDHDGLNSLKYQVISRDVNPLYTNITVDLLPTL